MNSEQAGIIEGNESQAMVASRAGRTFTDRIAEVLLKAQCPHGDCSYQHHGWAAHVAGRVEAELPRFGEIREAYEFYQLDSDKAMAAQIFVQQVGEILGCRSVEGGSVSQETAKKLRPA